jgi:DNA-binding transcriptional regulator LsrR (DeoR family)
MEPQNNLIWKTIPGYENYEISNTGLGKNIKFGKMKKLIEIPMKHFITNRVNVYKNGKRKFYYINKLLKEQFTQEELKVVPTNEETPTQHS